MASYSGGSAWDWLGVSQSAGTAVASGSTVVVAPPTSKAFFLWSQPEHEHADSAVALVPFQVSAEAEHIPVLSAPLDFVVFVIAAVISMSALCVVAKRAVLRAIEWLEGSQLRW